MKNFEVVINNKNGIHARPIGLLVEEASKYDSKIVVKGNGKMVEATKLIELMAMNIKYNDIVEIEVSGADEDEAYAKMKRFFAENL